MSKAVALVFLACIAWTSGSCAGEFGPVSPDGVTLRVDWQEPGFLPPRFRNHCTIENFRIARTIAAEIINSITARKARSAAAISATAIAISAASCAAIPDSWIAARRDPTFANR
jgi:hypothetical protein